MKKIIAVLIVLIVAVFIAGCWGETTVREQRKAPKPSAGVEVPGDSVGVVAEQPGPEVGVEIEPDVKTIEAGVDRSDCDGRLIPVYNIDNEVTRYRCVTDSQDFECPGHRAGDVWTEEDGCTECNCESDGSVVCTDAAC